MVEDENPPAYEPVSLNDPEVASLPEEPAVAPGTKRPGDDRDAPKPVSSSFRGLSRAVRANVGWRAFLKGFWCWIAMNMISGTAMSIFASAHPFLAPLGHLVATLAIIQLDTAWVHIVITPHSGRHFWRRLPSLKRAFSATWRPIVLYWFAAQAALGVTELTAWALGMNIFGADKGEGVVLNDLPWKATVVGLVALFASLALTVPAQVILVRVQASLLPPDEHTIIPFDRSFGGKVEPAVVSGKGYATISDVWSTFSRAAWRRLVVLYFKVFLVNGVISTAIATLIFAQFAIFGIASAAKSHN